MPAFSANEAHVHGWPRFMSTCSQSDDRSRGRRGSVRPKREAYACTSSTHRSSTIGCASPIDSWYRPMIAERRYCGSARTSVGAVHSISGGAPDGGVCHKTHAKDHLDPSMV